MAIWILEGECDAGHRAVLIDSVTGTPFGKTFADREEAEAFLAWYGDGDDPRLVHPRVLADDIDVFLVEYRSGVAS